MLGRTSSIDIPLFSGIITLKGGDTMEDESLSPDDKMEIMNLAWEMIKGYPGGGTTSEVQLERRTKLFDPAYKAIVETITEEGENS